VTYAVSRQTAEAAAMIAFATIGGLDGCMSDYRKDSELMQLWRAAGGAACPRFLGPLAVLSTAKRVAQASDGAFDVTVGPAVTLWRAARKTGKLSSLEEVQSARERVDWRRVELDEAHRTVTLRGKGMQIDLGGIAKGYAAAEALRKLRSWGYPQSLVALAGDIAVGDAPPARKAGRSRSARPCP